MSGLSSTRRRFLQSSAAALGVSLPQFLKLRQQAVAADATTSPVGKAKSCIVLYCWGGMSHHETWDPKPLASSEVRGEFQPISTRTPGVQLSEHRAIDSSQQLSTRQGNVLEYDRPRATPGHDSSKPASISRTLAITRSHGLQVSQGTTRHATIRSTSLPAGRQRHTTSR